MKNKTIQRKFILDYLQKTDNHPTAKEIYFALIPKLPQISQATVYRNLKLMAAEGKIQQIFLSNNEMHFDADLTPHFHAYCPKCGKIEFYHTQDEQSEIAQSICPTCGKKHDCDYPKCPFCGHRYV